MHDDLTNGGMLRWLTEMPQKRSEVKLMTWLPFFFSFF